MFLPTDLVVTSLLVWVLIRIRGSWSLVGIVWMLTPKPAWLYILPRRSHEEKFQDYGSCYWRDWDRLSVGFARVCGTGQKELPACHGRTAFAAKAMPDNSDSWLSSELLANAKYVLYLLRLIFFYLLTVLYLPSGTENDCIPIALSFHPNIKNQLWFFLPGQCIINWNQP